MNLKRAGYDEMISAIEVTWDFCLFPVSHENVF